MKKLNRKGFTLVELLAIIVILAIIMVVTIPTVLNSMDKAKESQLQNATDSVAEWFEKQYSLAKLGTIGGGTSAAYTTFTATAIPESATAPSSPKVLTVAILEAAGISDATTNIDVSGSGSSAKSTIWYNTTKGKMCVKLTAKSGGQFHNANDIEKTSSGC